MIKKIRRIKTLLKYWNYTGILSMTMTSYSGYSLIFLIAGLIKTAGG